MTANIVSINKEVDPHNEPVEAVVKAARAILREAENGTIRALAYAIVDKQENVSEGWQGANGTRLNLAAAVGLLNKRILDRIDQTSCNTSTYEE